MEHPSETGRDSKQTHLGSEPGRGEGRTGARFPSQSCGGPASCAPVSLPPTEVCSCLEGLLCSLSCIWHPALCLSPSLLLLSLPHSCLRLFALSALSLSLLSLPFPLCAFKSLRVTLLNCPGPDLFQCGINIPSHPPTQNQLFKGGPHPALDPFDSPLPKPQHSYPIIIPPSFTTWEERISHAWSQRDRNRSVSTGVGRLWGWGIETRKGRRNKFWGATVEPGRRV